MAKSLKDYRDKIIKLIISNKNICELVLDRTISDMDDADMQSELITNNIFRYKHVPPTQTEEKVFITFDLEVSLASRANKNYVDIKLTFFEFAHENIIHTKERNLRTDLIDDELQSIFNENEDIGLGLMYLAKDTPFSLGSVYHGRSLLFMTKDQNTSSCG